MDADAIFELPLSKTLQATFSLKSRIINNFNLSKGRGTVKLLRLTLILLHSFWLVSMSVATAETLSASDIATGIPQSLIDHGITKVASLELQPLVADIKSKVKWALLPVFSIGAGTNGNRRSGSSCRMSENSVFVNEPHLQNLKNIRLIRGLLLHEALCALGWDDDNYVISSTLGALEIISRSSSESDVNKAHQILENKDFLTAFRIHLKGHAHDQRFSSPKGLLIAGGGVTGVGGGGDGFGWYLKTMLFHTFFALHSVCADHPNKTEILYPGFDSKDNGFEMYLSCLEPRLYTWWSYLFSVTVETAYFSHRSDSTDFPHEMPWMGTFTIEEVSKSTSRFSNSQIQITIDSLRWMLLESNQWTQYSSGIFMTLMNSYYPRMNSEFIKQHPVVEVRGAKKYVEGFQNTFKIAPLKKCSTPNPNPEKSMSFSYSGVSLMEYIQKRVNLSETELSAPPHCVDIRN